VLQSLLNSLRDLLQKLPATRRDLQARSEETEMPSWHTAVLCDAGIVLAHVLRSPRGWGTHDRS